MDLHVHVHALVPGGGPSLDGRRWVRSRHPKQRRRRQPFLVDNQRLGREFRKKFVAGLKRLHRRGEIHFTPPVLPGEYEPDFIQWIEGLAEQWNVFIQPPPPGTHAEQVLKYLARYMTGGPISDRRLISHQHHEVTFWARGKTGGNKSRPYTLPAREFVRRWALHVLPKGFTKSRPYGGFSNTLRGDYLQQCRDLLKLTDEEAGDTRIPPEDTSSEPESERTCPHCQTPLVCIRSSRRASWRDLLADYAIRPLWYQPAWYPPPPSFDARHQIRAPEP